MTYSLYHIKADFTPQVSQKLQEMRQPSLSDRIFLLDILIEQAAFDYPLIANPQNKEAVFLISEITQFINTNSRISRPRPALCKPDNHSK